MIYKVNRDKTINNKGFFRNIHFLFLNLLLFKIPPINVYLTKNSYVRKLSANAPIKENINLTYIGISKEINNI